MDGFRSWLLSIKRIDVLVAGWLVILVGVTSWSLFRPAFFRVHDYVHAARIAELTRSATAGHLPVRWTENFGYGYGMPLFEFYAPLPYYLGGLIYWITNDVVLASKALFFLPNLGAVVGAYLIGRALYGRKGGVLVATAFALAPYRAVNLFVRGAVSESWGMMAMPFILWWGVRWARSLKTGGQKWNWVGLVLSLVVLFLSHNLSTLMFVPVSGLFLMLVLWQELANKDVKVYLSYLVQLGLAYLLAIGLTAFYLFPALLEKDFTIISSILSGYFFYSHHFLYIRQLIQPRWGYGGSAWGPDDGISFFLGYGQLLAVALGGVAVAWFGWHQWQRHANWSLVRRFSASVKRAVRTDHLQLFVLSGLIVLGSLFLTLLRSEWWWQNLPLITYIQFPWRWLSVAAMFLALMAGYGATLVQSKRGLVLWVVGLLAIMGLSAPYFQPESYLGNNDDYYYADPARIRTQMSGILPDYIPIQLKIEALATEDQATQSALLPPNAEGAIVSESSKTELGEYAVAVNRPHQKLIDVSLANPTVVEFAVAAYPGWQAELDGKPVATAVSEVGLVTVEVPAGQHSVGVYFGSTQVRQVSDTISVIALCILLYLTMPVVSTKKS